MGGWFDSAELERNIAELREQTLNPEFWNHHANAQKVSKQLSALESKQEEIRKIATIGEDLQVYLQMVQEDNSFLTEAVSELKQWDSFLEKVEINALLSGELDAGDAILTINPGAGGTESQDWAEMLLRMYLRWAERSGFKAEIVELLPGEEAGIKSVTVEVKGEFAYGYLACEIGIHRLVRISPFNAQGKRQTSFASIFVYPLVDDSIEVEIDAGDLRIDTYRASGKGGQCVNTTDSAVRITHLPTGIVVQCQNERSQLKNKEHAMKILKSRLYQHFLHEKQKESKELEDTKTEIGWGNQIRSYVFHPYQMVKDHRTKHEVKNTEKIMDGDLDGFIEEYLRYKMQK